MSKETYSDEGPKCPHCHAQITADDPLYYDEMNYSSDECDECGGKFTVSVNTTTTWWCEAVVEEPA